VTGGELTGSLTIDGLVGFGKPAPSHFPPISFLFSERGVVVYNRDGQRVASLSTSERRILIGPIPAPAGSGELALGGATGLNAVRAFVTVNGGRIEVYDKNGNLRSAIDGSGVKPFIMPHPDQQGKQIVYAALEGPEAAAYLRGRAVLTAGSATVAYPDHFTAVVNPDTVTVTLTPRSADSRGLAVTASDASGFRVQELGGGTGGYEFDYSVIGVRKGYEHFQPVVGEGENHFGERLTAEPEEEPGPAG
jgi:hypothetical protein